jgi:hypothetical protein
MLILPGGPVSNSAGHRTNFAELGYRPRQPS